MFNLLKALILLLFFSFFGVVIFMLLGNGYAGSSKNQEDSIQKIDVSEVFIRRNILRQLKQTTPLKVDEFVTLIDAKVRDNHLVLIYRITDTTKDELSGWVGEEMRQDAKFTLCETDAADLTKDYFDGYIYSYQDENGEVLHSFRIEFSECGFSNLEQGVEHL